MKLFGFRHLNYAQLVITVRLADFAKTTQNLCYRAIACRLSVRLSVTLVDQGYIGWKSWKLIARTVSPKTSLFVAQRTSTYSQGNMGKLWGD